MVKKFSYELIEPKNLLKTLHRYGVLIEFVVKTLKNIPELENHKHNPDLILYICKVVENTFKKKTIADEKINKKDTVIQIIMKLIPTITEQDKIIIDGIIEHLHSSGRIKKVSSLKVAVNFITSFLKK